MQCNLCVKKGCRFWNGFDCRLSKRVRITKNNGGKIKFIKSFKTIEAGTIGEIKHKLSGFYDIKVGNILVANVPRAYFERVD